MRSPTSFVLLLLLLTCKLCRRWLRVCTSGDIWRLRFDEKLPASVLQRLEGAQVCVQPLGGQAVPGPADNCKPCSGGARRHTHVQCLGCGAPVCGTQRATLLWCIPMWKGCSVVQPGSLSDTLFRARWSGRTVDDTAWRGCRRVVARPRRLRCCRACGTSCTVPTCCGTPTGTTQVAARARG